MYDVRACVGIIMICGARRLAMAIVSWTISQSPSLPLSIKIQLPLPDPLKPSHDRVLLRVFSAGLQHSNQECRIHGHPS